MLDWINQEPEDAMTAPTRNQGVITPDEAAPEPALRQKVVSGARTGEPDEKLAHRERRPAHSPRTGVDGDIASDNDPDDPDAPRCG